MQNGKNYETVKNSENGEEWEGVWEGVREGGRVDQSEACQLIMSSQDQ